MKTINKILKYSLIFLLGIVSYQCAFLESLKPPQIIIQIIEKFIRDSKGEFTYEQITAIKFNFYYETDGAIIAVCKYPTLVSPAVIELDFNVWEIQSDIERKATIYHELGHCLLHEGHRDSYFKDHCPTSLMNTYSTTEGCLKKYWKYYVKELFIYSGVR